MFSFRLHVKWTEHNNTAAVWSGRTREARKNVKRVFFCLLSHIFKKKKKSFETQEISGFSSRRSEVVGVVGVFWEEFTASAARSSMKGRTSIHFFFGFFFFPPPVVNSLQVSRLPPLAIWQFHGAVQHFQWDERRVTPVGAVHTRSPQVPTRKRVPATSHHQLKKKNRNSTVWTHTYSQHDNTYQPMQIFFFKKKKSKKGRQGSEVEGMCSYRFSSEPSFPVLVHFVGRFASAFWGSLSVAAGAQIHLVHLFERLVQVVLKWGHGGADGRRAEAVGDEAEVGQAALDSRFHDGGRPWVSERWAVLCQQVCELLADLPEGRKKVIVANRMLTENASLDFMSARFHRLLCRQEHILARVDFVALYMWPAQIFCNRLCGELRFTHVAKVSG